MAGLLNATLGNAYVPSSPFTRFRWPAVLSLLPLKRGLLPLFSRSFAPALPASKTNYAIVCVEWSLSSLYVLLV